MSADQIRENSLLARVVAVDTTMPSVPIDTTFPRRKNQKPSKPQAFSLTLWHSTPTLSLAAGTSRATTESQEEMRLLSAAWPAIPPKTSQQTADARAATTGRGSRDTHTRNNPRRAGSCKMAPPQLCNGQTKRPQRKDCSIRGGRWKTSRF